MGKLFMSLLFLTVTLQPNIASAQSKDAAKTTVLKVKSVPEKGVKKVKSAPVTKVLPVSGVGKTVHKNTSGKRHIVKNTINRPSHATQKEEVIEIEDNREQTTVEIDKGRVYVNGEQISTIDNPSKEHHKIIIRKDKQNLTVRTPVSATDAAEEYRHKPMLGVYTEKNTDFSGAYITEIVKNSPASDVGLLRGDVIVKINNKDIRDAGDLSTTINDHNGGERVEIAYVRDGKQYHTEAELAETNTRRRRQTYDYTIPDLHGVRRYPSPYLHSFMFNAVDNEYEYGPQMGIEAQDAKDGRGVAVLSVKKNTPADIAGLKDGDVILRLDHIRTTSTDDIQDILADTWPNQRITIQFKREGVTMYAYMRFSNEKMKKDL